MYLLHGKKVFEMRPMHDMNEYLIVYNLLDTVLLGVCMESFFNGFFRIYKVNPRMFGSMAKFLALLSLKLSGEYITVLQDAALA